MAATCWAYKATPKKVGRQVTMLLSRWRGFLCRSLRRGRVSEVAAGDEMLLYFSGDKEPGLGRYRVVEPAQHPHPEWFDGNVGDTALCWVSRDSALHAWMVENTGPRGRSEGYAVDPRTKAYPGWPLVRLGDAPEYDPMLFPGRTTLVRLRSG